MGLVYSDGEILRRTAATLFTPSVRPRASEPMA